MRIIMMRLSVIFGLLAIVFLAGCDPKNHGMNVNDVENSGDGTLRILSKPGLLGSKGAILQFDTFDLVSGFDRKLSIKNLPCVKQPYRLFISPSSKLSDDLANNIAVKTTLKDNDGNIIWDVENHLADWMVSESSGVVEYYYMRAVTNLVECKLNPVKGREYELLISIKADKDNSKDASVETQLYLRAGGFK